MPSMPVGKGALQPHMFVAAIDFGTTYSGYAFQGRDDFLQDPIKVQDIFESRSKIFI